jgi:hypothetical protein
MQTYLKNLLTYLHVLLSFPEAKPYDHGNLPRDLPGTTFLESQPSMFKIRSNFPTLRHLKRRKILQHVVQQRKRKEGLRAVMHNTDLVQLLDISFPHDSPK